MFRPVVVAALLATPVLGLPQQRLELNRLYSLPRLTGTPPEGLAWSADSTKLAFLWSPDGDDRHGIWLVDVTNPAPVPLTIAPSVRNDDAADHASTNESRISEVLWHPDNERLLFQRAGELWLQKEGGAARLLADGGASKARFSPDGRHVAFLRDGGLWVVAVETPDNESGPTLLVGDPNPDVRVENFRWAPRERRIAFTESDARRVPLRGVPDTTGTEIELVAIRRPFPGEEPLSRRLGVVRVSEDSSSSSSSSSGPEFFDLGARPVELIFSYRWSKTGRLLIDRSDLYVKSRRILSLDPDTGAIVEFLREDDPENTSAFWQAEWAPDGRGIYFLSERDGTYQIYFQSEPGGQPERVTTGDFEVSWFEISKPANAIYFVSNAPRPEERQLFRVPLHGTASDGVATADSLEQMSREPGTHDPVVSPDGVWAGDIISSDRMPQELFLTKLDGTGTERRLTESPLPGFEEIGWIEAEYVRFDSQVDDATLHGRLMRPRNLEPGKRYPVIMGSVYTNTVRNQWGGRNVHPLWGLDQYLLQEGYVLFTVDIRGSWGHGRAFRRGIRLDYGGIDVEDLASGVAYLRTLDFVDPQRIGIWGSSYGGLLTCMSLFKKPGLYRAGVAGAPATNVFHALTGEMRVMMAPQDEPDAYRAASAYTYAEGLQDPLLIIHGMKDQIVLYKDSLVLVERLMRLGKNVDLLTLPDAGHGWDREELYETRFAFKKLVEFFDRNLGRGPR